MFNNKFTKHDPVADSVLKILESSWDDEDDDVARADRELRRMKAKPIEADKKTDPDKEISKLAKKTPKEIDESWDDDEDDDVARADRELARMKAKPIAAAKIDTDKDKIKKTDKDKEEEKMDESVEQIDELDSTTLSRYSQKARTSRNSASNELSSRKKKSSDVIDKLSRKLKNRNTGLERAKSRLDKEKVDHKPKNSTDIKDIHDTLIKHGFTRGKTYSKKDGNLKDAKTPNRESYRADVTHSAVTDYHHPKLGTVSVGHDQDNKHGAGLQPKWARHNKPSEDRNHVILSANKPRGTLFNREADTAGKTDTDLHKHLNNLRTGKHTALHTMHDKDYPKTAWTRSWGEEVEISEKTLSPAESKKKEEIVKSMKKDKAGLKDRYGKRWKEVAYATATKSAKRVAEDQWSDIAGKESDWKPSKKTPSQAMSAARNLAGKAMQDAKKKKLKKEEVEHIVELSKKTLRDYMRANTKRMADPTNPDSMERKMKRHDDYFKASKKVNEAKGPTSDYGLETFATNESPTTPLERAKSLAKSALSKIKSDLGKK